MNKRYRSTFRSVALALPLTAAILILLWAALIIGAEKRAATAESGIPTHRYVYTLRMGNIPAYMTHHIRLGDPVTNATDKTLLGRVSSLSVSPVVKEYLSADGKALLRAEHPSLTEVLVTVTADAREAGRLALQVGARQVLWLPDFAALSLCLGAEELELPQAGREEIPSRTGDTAEAGA